MGKAKVSLQALVHICTGTGSPSWWKPVARLTTATEGTVRVGAVPVESAGCTRTALVHIGAAPLEESVARGTSPALERPWRIDTFLPGTGYVIFTFVYILTSLARCIEPEARGTGTQVGPLHVLAAPVAARWGASLAFIHINTWCARPVGAVSGGAGTVVASSCVVTTSWPTGRGVPGALVYIFTLRALEARWAGASERARQVFTVAPATGARALGTFVDVLAARSMGGSLVPSWANTQEAAGSVLTPAIGAGLLGTFIHILTFSALWTGTETRGTDTAVAAC